MLPVRCFTCNKIIGQYQDAFDVFLSQHSKRTIPYQEFFQTHDIKRYCCRKIFVTHIDIYEHCSEFQHEMIECRSHSEVPVIYRAI